MLMILHAEGGPDPVRVPGPLLDDADLICLAGPPGAFDESDLPSRAGAVGGQILRLDYLAPQGSAFALLADCSGMMARIMAQRLRGLSYRRVTPGGLPAVAAPPASRISWSVDPVDGRIDRFDLPPLVATSPVLAAVTRDLARRGMDDDRRFRFLTAAFAGE